MGCKIHNHLVFMEIYDLAHGHRFIKADIKRTYPYKYNQFKILINTFKKKYKYYIANHQEKKATERLKHRCWDTI